MGRVLVVIDVQQDYFPGGAYPLWNAEETFESVVRAVRRAQAQGVPVVLVQHVADGSRGPAPFFNAGTSGVDLHADLRREAPNAEVVVKAHADSFLGTQLEAALHRLGATELLLCGMMTQNCVTHTALSKGADPYAVTVIPEACTTVTELLHRIALSALAPRVALRDLEAALPA